MKVCQSTIFIIHMGSKQATARHTCSILDGKSHKPFPCAQKSNPLTCTHETAQSAPGGRFMCQLRHSTACTPHCPATLSHISTRFANPSHRASCAGIQRPPQGTAPRWCPIGAGLGPLTVTQGAYLQDRMRRHEGASCSGRLQVSPQLHRHT